MRAATKLLCLVAGLGLPACQSATSYHLDEGTAALAHADYDRALVHFRQAQELDPGDTDLSQRVRETEVLALRDRARQLVFDNQDEEAIALLDRVLQIKPGDKLSLDWQLKARTKLAKKATHEGTVFYFVHDLENALKSFHKAFQYVPGYEGAEEGVKLVAADYERRQKKANDHYIEGVRALAERLFGQTYYHMFNSLANDPNRADAEQRKKVATQRLLQKRFAVAQDAERLKAWRTALAEYRAIRTKMPDYPGVEARIAAMEKEVEADELARKAERMLVRGDTAGAIQTLEQAMEKTGRERLRMSELVAAARDKETETAFQRARDLEYDNKYEAALEAYRAIEQKHPGYSNVRARMGYLEETLRLVDQAYQKGVAAETAGDNEKALSCFKEAQASLPGYKDTVQRLERLKAAVGK